MKILSASPLVASAVLVLSLSIGQLIAQTGEPWTDKQLKDPGALAKALKDPKVTPPVILNIGPVDQIKGAIRIGPTVSQDNLEALRKQLAKLPKDKEVVIYCGCCPFRRCPNVRPAFELLKEMKFTKARLLNLPTSLNEDWVNKGYPME
jgi:thiosulfate/3-mercaptopyruvate sulfurtransferase